MAGEAATDLDSEDVIAGDQQWRDRHVDRGGKGLHVAELRTEQRRKYVHARTDVQIFHPHDGSTLEQRPRNLRSRHGCRSGVYGHCVRIDARDPAKRLPSCHHIAACERRHGKIERRILRRLPDPERYAILEDLDTGTWRIIGQRHAGLPRAQGLKHDRRRNRRRAAHLRGSGRRARHFAGWKILLSGDSLVQYQRRAQDKPESGCVKAGGFGWSGAALDCHRRAFEHVRHQHGGIALLQWAGEGGRR